MGYFSPCRNKIPGAGGGGWGENFTEESVSFWFTFQDDSPPHQRKQGRRTRGGWSRRIYNKEADRDEAWCSFCFSL